MKKATAGILLFDMAAGLLLMGFYGMYSGAVAADSGMVNAVEGERLEAEGAMDVEDVRKIAITFDGDVIIGSSQGIC